MISRENFIFSITINCLILKKKLFKIELCKSEMLNIQYSIYDWYWVFKSNEQINATKFLLLMMHLIIESRVLTMRDFVFIDIDIVKNKLITRIHLKSQWYFFRILFVCIYHYLKRRFLNKNFVNHHCLYFVKMNFLKFFWVNINKFDHRVHIFLIQILFHEFKINFSLFFYIFYVNYNYKTKEFIFIVTKTFKKTIKSRIIASNIIDSWTIY